MLASLVGARVTEVRIRNIERPAGTIELRPRPDGQRLPRHPVPVLRALLLRPTAQGVREDRRLLLIAIGVAISGSLVGYSWVTGTPTIRERGGWFLLSSLLMLGGLQTLLTGILAEILVRIYYQAARRNRPTSAASGIASRRLG